MRVYKQAVGHLAMCCGTFDGGQRSTIGALAGQLGRRRPKEVRMTPLFQPPESRSVTIRPAADFRSSR